MTGFDWNFIICDTNGDYEKIGRRVVRALAEKDAELATLRKELEEARGEVKRQKAWKIVYSECARDLRRTSVRQSVAIKIMEQRDAFRAERDKLRAELKIQDNANDILTRQNQELRAECERLKEEIEALTHEGRQGELEQANVEFAEESERLRTALREAMGALEACAGGDLASSEGIYKAEVANEALESIRALVPDGGEK